MRFETFLQGAQRGGKCSKLVGFDIVKAGKSCIRENTASVFNGIGRGRDADRMPEMQKTLVKKYLAP